MKFFNFNTTVIALILVMIISLPHISEASFTFKIAPWLSTIKAALTQAKINSSVNGFLRDGLVGQWSFDGPDTTNTTALDRSGQNNTGTLDGMTLASNAIAGKNGQAIDFDGVDDQIIITNMDTYGIMSIALWIKRGRNDNPTHDGLMGCQDGGGWGIGISDPDGGLIFLTQIGLSNVTSVGTITDFDWHHIVITYDGNDAIFYIDGVFDATAAYSVLPFDCSGGAYTIGNSNSTTWYQGILDDVRVYNRVISAEEVARLYRLAR